MNKKFNFKEFLYRFMVPILFIIIVVAGLIIAGEVVKDLAAGETQK